MMYSTNVELRKITANVEAKAYLLLRHVLIGRGQSFGAWLRSKISDEVKKEG